jgi:hypothetical protein
VRGYKERGNINTPMELAINNEIDRFTLAIDVIDRVPKLKATAPTRRRNSATSRLLAVDIARVWRRSSRHCCLALAILIRRTIMSLGSQPKLTERQSWTALANHYEILRNVHLRTLFADNPERGERFAVASCRTFTRLL